MSSDWMREHKETNATRGGASMVGCLCCLRGERKRCRLVIVNWRFPCLRTRFVSTKREIRTGEVVCVVFRTKERGVVS